MRGVVDPSAGSASKLSDPGNLGIIKVLVVGNKDMSH